MLLTTKTNKMSTQIENKLLETKKVCGLLKSVKRGELDIISMLIESNYSDGLIYENELKELLIKLNNQGLFWFNMVLIRMEEFNQFNDDSEKIELVNFDSLIGKKLFAYGWQYDNDGTCVGIITHITHNERFTSKMSYTIHVNSDSEYSMSSFVFEGYEMVSLIKDGCLPKVDRYCDSGKNAKVI